MTVHSRMIAGALREGQAGSAKSIAWWIVLSSLPTLPLAADVGISEPIVTAQVAASEPGILATLDVRLGDRVRVGQQLASQDLTELHASLAIAERKAAAEGSLAAAQAVRELSQIRLERMKQLARAGHATQEEHENAVSEFRIAEARWLAASEQAALDALAVRRIQSMIEQRRLTSPVDGVVVEIHKTPGEYVGGADSTVATVVRLDRLRVKFYLSETAIAKLAVGRPAYVQMPQSAAHVAGVVSFISPIVDSRSGTVRVDVVVDNPHSRLRGGQQCRLELDGAARSASNVRGRLVP